VGKRYALMIAKFCFACPYPVLSSSSSFEVD
jgi:hypothetical protein